MSELNGRASFHGEVSLYTLSQLRRADQVGRLLLKVARENPTDDSAVVDITSNCRPSRCGREIIRSAIPGQIEGIIYCDGCGATTLFNAHEYNPPPIRVLNTLIQRS